MRTSLQRGAIGLTALVAALAFTVAPAAAVSANSANNSGPYDSTFPAGPSENGNGNGKAVGRPDAGEVGKADNKNPKGQLPDAASDGNAGYECDTNSGIAKGNPAHTGCTTTPPEEG
jgi:hypothetical protein